MIEKKFITYKEYDILISDLVFQIKESSIFKNIKLIYTFIRGGLPIATHLSHFLDRPLLIHNDEIDLSTIPCDSMLVTDDIADTGKTLDGFQRLFPTATLFYKPRSIVEPTFYVLKTEKWVVFPWERIDEEMNR
jgi:hypoxanthine phosphoribosyltransferase